MNAGSGNGRGRLRPAAGRAAARVRRGVGRAAARVVRMALAFVLAFGTTCWAQGGTALAAPGAGADAAAAAAAAAAAPASPGPAPAGQVAAQAEDDAGDDSSEDADEAARKAAEEEAARKAAEEEAARKAEEEQQDSLRIADIGVFRNGTTRDAFAYASERSRSKGEVRAVIDRRGGQIDFDAAVLWNDGSDWEYDSPKVQWRLGDGDGALARLSPSGILEAAGVDDGTVSVTAYVDGSYTQDGNELACEFLVDLRGQTDTKYVTGITICDDQGQPIDPSYRFQEGTLSTAMLELSARVRVHDPATDAEVEYLVTPSSGLAAQTGGELADLVWESADTRLGTVSDEGIYRPAVAATNLVYCVSTAGFDGSRVTAQATLDMPPSSGKEAANGYHPQSTLTVKVFYEDYPDQQVAEKKFSVADLEALGVQTRTYTALRGKEGYMTTTGRGPLLAKVLEAAGVNTAGVSRLRFGTPDNYQGTVSWSMLVDTDRYYFPNIDIGSYAGAVQVPPMVAIDAYRNVGSDVSVHSDGMTNTRRFLLLFGAKKTGETTTNLQVYNIHTLYVDLQGSPPSRSGGSKVNVRFVDGATGEVLKSVDTADPESVQAPQVPQHDGMTFAGWAKSTDKKGNVTYTATYSQQEGEGANPGGNEGDAGDGSGGGQGSTPANQGGADAKAGQGAYDLVSTAQSGAGGADAGKEQAAEQLPVDPANLTQLDPNDVKTMTTGRWSVLQAINRHPSDVDDLMLENPLAPYAAPFFAGSLAAGGVEAGVAFARQKRRPRAAVAA